MLIVGIAGGTGSGKTTLATRLAETLGSQRVTVIPHDSYYLDHLDLTFAERSQLNFDEPAAFETSLLVTHLQALSRGETVQRPTYDFSVHARSPRTVQLPPKPVVIVEGILVLAIPGLRDMFDLKVFVDTAADIRLARRITRDVSRVAAPWSPSATSTSRLCAQCTNCTWSRPSTSRTSSSPRAATTPR